MSGRCVSGALILKLIVITHGGRGVDALAGGVYSSNRIKTCGLALILFSDSVIVSFYRVILKNDYLGPMAIGLWTFTGYQQ